MMPCFDLGGFRIFGKVYSDGLHTGKDFSAPEGTPVYSITQGEVILFGLFNGYGSLNPSSKGGCVWIKHKIGDKIFYAQYGHLNIIDNLPKLLKEGDIIGKVAGFKNGNNYWPHLHFSIWDSEEMFPNNNWGYIQDRDIKKYTDPIPFLKKYNLA